VNTSGSNFDDNEKKTTGGRNGYGAKLSNIFSTQFTVETADKERRLKFKQVFRKNMTERYGNRIRIARRKTVSLQERARN
jgi:DNA topoisomerase-2